MGKKKRPISNTVKLGGIFDVTCYDKDGNFKWQDTAKNLVPNEGLQLILDLLFLGATQDSSAWGALPKEHWYVGLTDGSPSPAAADTMASHGGWTEYINYTGDRKEYVGTRTAQEVSNSGSKASFTISGESSAGDATVGGAFMTAAATGTAETLLCCAAFSGGNKSVDEDDTLEVTYTFSAADDGS